MKKTLLVGMIFFLLNACNSNEYIVRFSTPEDTLMVYHLAIEKGDENLVQECFIKQQHLLEGFSKSLPKNYKYMFKIKRKKNVTEEDIVEMEQRIKKNDADFKRGNPDTTYSMYQEFIRDRDIYKKAGDMEIVVKEFDNENSSYENTYYLRNINGEWKIIAIPFR
jgi:hypothetical protein